MTDTLLDSTIRRDAQLQRFGTYLKSEYITPAYQKLARDIPKLLVNFDDLNKFEQKRLIKEINELMGNQLSDMFQSITDELHGMAADEGEFIFDLYDDFTELNFKALEAAAVIKAADTAVLSLEKGKGRTVGLWSELLADNIAGATKEVDSIVRDGFRGGKTLNEMVQQIRGTYNRGTKKYMGGILDTTTSRAEALARTGVSHYSNRARDEFFDKNSKLLPESVFFATLDNRVTTICLSLHLTVWDNDNPKKPVLPLHYGERSVMLFKGPGIDPLEGTRPVISGRKGAGELFDEKQSRTDKKVKYKGRASNDVFEVEQVSAKVTSQQWLQRQPRYFVESTLGKERAKLFLDGGLDIKKFTDLTGRPLSLKELKQTAAGERAFRRAGID